MHLDCQSFKAGLRKAKSQRFALITDAGPAMIWHVIVYCTFSQESTLSSRCQRTGATDGANEQMGGELGKGEGKRRNHFEEL